MTSPISVGILGAGAVGTYLGLGLSAVGVQVTMVGRPRWMDTGPDLRAVTRTGHRLEPQQDAVFTTDASALHGVDVCLVTVKSTSTSIAAKTLAEVLRPDTPVVSLQNGLDNPQVLRAQLGDRVVGAMVPFNVFRTSNEVVQATRGPLVIERCGDERDFTGERLALLARAFERSGHPVRRCDHIEDIAAGKLLLNLNNGVCAATGLSIADSLRNRDARWLLSRCMLEGLKTLQRAGYRPRTTLPIPVAAIARLLAAPDALVLRVAKGLLAVDGRARSSTLQDVEAGRPTEIEHLNGSIVRMGRALGVPCRVNAVVVDRVRALEGGGAFASPKGLRTRALA